MGILWAPPVDTVRVQSTVTQTEVLCFDNYSGLSAFELVFLFLFNISLSLSFVSFVLCLKQQKKHEEIDDYERQVFVGFAWFVSDALCVRRAGGGGGWRRSIQVARAHH